MLGPKGGAKQPYKEGRKTKDMSKVKCFACNKMGHYVVTCPNKNKKKQVVALIEVNELSSQLEK